MPGVRPPWGGGASGWATPSGVTAQSIVVYGGRPAAGILATPASQGDACSLEAVCVGTRTSVWLGVGEPLAPACSQPSPIHM